MALNNHVENFTLDMAPGGIAPVLNVSQGDTGRAYTADMYWGGASYDVSGLTVRLRGRKRDNTVFDYALPAPSGTKVAFDLEDKEQVTIIPGNVECELVFTDSNSRVVGTANFVFIVEESPYDPNAISESEVTGLVDLISDQIGGAVDDWFDENLDSPEFEALVFEGVQQYAEENNGLNFDGVLYERDLTPIMQNGFVTLNVGIGNTVNPAPTVRTDYKYIIVPCKAGDKFIYTGRGAESARPWAFTDENYVVERVEWANATPEGLLLIANNDGYFIANARVAYDFALYQYNDLSIVQDEAVGNYDISAAYRYLGYIDCSAGIGNAISLTPTYNTAYRNISIRCKKGDKFEIYALGAAAARLWAFTDENGVLLEMSGEHIDSQTNGVFVTAPADGWFISNARYHRETDYVRKVIYYKNYSYFDVTRADVPVIVADELENKGVVYRTVAEYVDNKYIDTDEAIGTEIDVSNPIGNGSYCYWIVPVETGDIVKVTGTGSTTARLWAFTDTEYKLVSNSAASLVGENILLNVEQDGYCIINSQKTPVHNAEVIRNGASVTAITEQNENKYKEQLRFIMGRNYAIGYANAMDRLDMVNYLGNNQNTHPKVLYFENGLFGHKYWMAYTPYPYGSTTYENPCIAYSDDGYNWQGIAANPLAEPLNNNTTNYNSDTHLVYNEDTGNLECWYRHCNETDRIETIYRRVSSDGLTWGNAEAVFTSSGATNKALSPAVIYDASENKYCMWLVSGSGGFHIEYWEGNASAANWTKIRDISLTYEYDNKSYFPWHLDVIKDNGKYVALVMAKDNWSAGHNEEWILFLATSDDNATYTTPAAVMIGNPTGWDTRLYRSSIVNIGGKYRIYYAGRNESTYYAMSITESDTLGGFIGWLE